MAKNNANVSSEQSEVSYVINPATRGDVNDTLARLVASMQSGRIIGRDGKPVQLPDNGGELTCSVIQLVNPLSATLDDTTRFFSSDGKSKLMMFRIDGTRDAMDGHTLIESAPNFGVVDIGLFYDSPENRTAVKAAIQSAFATDNIASREWVARCGFFVTDAKSLQKSSGSSGSPKSAAEALMVSTGKGKVAKSGGVTSGLASLLTVLTRRK